MKTLYLDHQASTPVDDRVLQEMLPFFSETFGNPHSSEHASGWQSSAAIDTASQQVADLIGADSDEVIFTSGATEANNLALLGLARRAALTGSSRRRVLLSAIEHKCVLSTGRILADQCGNKVDLVPVDQDGYIILEELERLLDEDVLLVSIMAVNNEIGTIQDIKVLSEAIRKCGAVFHCDAAQAPMAMSVKNLAFHTDMASLSAHKMYGPKGIGALYIRRDLQEQIEPQIYGGGQQNGLRSGTLPTPLCVGMGAAAKFMGSAEASKKRSMLRARTDRFLDMLTVLPWPTQLYGPDRDKRHAGNISVGFPGFNAQDILGSLQPHLAASTGSACTSGIPEPSHVLRAIGLTVEQADSVIRFSLGFETSDEELEPAVQLIEQALTDLPSYLI